MTKEKSPIARRFRGFLPVVVDLETGGFDSQKHALLEMAGCPIEMTEDGLVTPGPMVAVHVAPFPGSLLDPKSLEITGIIPDHPLRQAVDEKTALQTFCSPIREAMRASGCGRAVLVGHNPSFDLGFLNAAINRTGYKRSPFHPFSSFDTATLGGLAFGQTVLARATRAAGFPWDANEAHSAVYDVEKTAALFCSVVNRWHESMGIPWSEKTPEDTEPGPDQPAS
ncbi:MAG: ribonuclease T [Lysobacterales bacterium]